jgi:hypothetical protein
MVTVRKWTSDDGSLFVFISRHEHRPLAPIPIKIPAIGTGRMMVKTDDILSTV